MSEVIATDEFVAWFRSLDSQAGESVEDAVFRLEQAGVRLGHPYSSAIKGTKVAMRELRVQSGGRPFRIFYAFDPKRDAVLLLGGDKTGDERFYERLLPQAERIWAQYLEELAAEGRKGGGR